MSAFTDVEDNQGHSAVVPALWGVRGGRDGIIEEYCLKEGYCGIGWGNLGDLSVLGEEGLAAELHVAYPHTIAAWRSSMENFMRIEQATRS